MVIPEYLPIDDHPSLARHTTSMAVVNVDRAAKIRYKSSRDRILKEKSEIITIKDELEKLKGLVEFLMKNKEV